MGRVCKSGLNVLQRLEGANHESRAHQQNQSHGYLGDDQGPGHDRFTASHDVRPRCVQPMKSSGQRTSEAGITPNNNPDNTETANVKPNVAL